MNGSVFYFKRPGGKHKFYVREGRFRDSLRCYLYKSVVATDFSSLCKKMKVKFRMKEAGEVTETKPMVTVEIKYCCRDCQYFKSLNRHTGCHRTETMLPIFSNSKRCAYFSSRSGLPPYGRHRKPVRKI